MFISLTYLQLAFVLADFAALHAGWPLALLVYCYVFVQVGFLRERLAAVGFGANKGSFASMNTKVVEKVMPFPEEHFATAEVALQELHVALRAGVFVLENSELSS